MRIADTDLAAAPWDGDLTGVGFVDEIHGQTGVAPNGIELHPVLGFRMRTRCRHG